MKASFVFRFAVFVIVAGCNSPAANISVKEFVPGTYIRFGEQEFGKEWDTLTIAVQNASANEYSIQRAWKYARVLDGKSLEPEYKVSKTSAIYDAGANLLREGKTGKNYSFNPDENAVFAGTTKYLKLK